MTHVADARDPDEADPATPADRMLCTIVGAGPGLGAALAARFVRGGFDAALVCRSPSRLDAWRTQQPDPRRIATFRGDAASIDDLDRAFAAIRSWRGDTDVLICNVADLTPDPVDQLDTERLLDALRTDVGGTLESVRQVLPAMRRRGRGTILVTGGGLAIEPYPEWASLSAGKAALRSVALNLHKALLPAGIHVAVVAVCGIVADDGPFAADRIAEEYWALHQEPISRATREVVYLPEGGDPFYNDPGRVHRRTSLPITR